MRLSTQQFTRPKGSYVMIEALLKSRENSERQRAALAVAEVATIFELRYPGSLQRLFEDVINPPNGAILWREGSMRLSASPAVPPEAMADAIRDDFSRIHKLNPSDRNRLQLAARWFRRGYEALNQIDKFLFWWTVLEIYPAAETSDVANRTADFLVCQMFKKSNRAEIKEKLELGRMTGTRAKIVHDGQAFVNEEERVVFERRLNKLHAVSSTCLRLLAGLPPGNELDPFVTG